MPRDSVYVKIFLSSGYKSNHYIYICRVFLKTFSQNGSKTVNLLFYFFKKVKMF